MTTVPSEKMEQIELIPGATDPVPKQKNARNAKEVVTEHLPPNIAQPVKAKVPDFSDPNRPHTCLEVDFPIVPINALSALEGNAGKPIYQMSKWWARRRSCVFRAMLIAAAIEAPPRKKDDGSIVLDENGVPEPDVDEAHKAVWDVYYTNHQKAENFKHLKVMDCFMGGGTTLVEGSRLGFQMSGVDLNPVAWFVTKNELACTDADEVERFFDVIEAEVKPQVQPFYATDEPDGTPGRWFDVASGTQVDVDPATLPPDKRKKYRYEGPEVIYTFWAKHGPCIRPKCDHRTPIFTSPVIAEKKLGVKYIELTCKQCKTAFHAELGSARMAPAAERVVLDSEHPFTELSQPFATRVMDYAKGNRNERFERVSELLYMVDDEQGLMCPACGSFAGEWMRNVLTMHKSAQRASHINKKHLKILPARNSKKSIFSYLLVHPDWLRGAPGRVEGIELGGYADGTPNENASWYAARLKALRLIEVRGRIKLSEDTSATSIAEHAIDDQHAEADANTESPDGGETERQPTDRKDYGLPQYITLADGTRINTRYSTVPKQSHFTCGGCGQLQDLRYSVQDTKRLAPVAPYAIQCYSAQRDADGHPYGGRYFRAPTGEDIGRIVAAEGDWCERKDSDLADHWPREKMPHTYMTHQANFSLPEQGYTHWWKMFGPRQLLVHALLLRATVKAKMSEDLTNQVLGAIQQYLRNQSSFGFWNPQRDTPEPFFSNPNFAPKMQSVENCVFGTLGRGNWTSTVEKIVDGLEWKQKPWEVALPQYREETGESRIPMEDAVLSGVDIHCGSASDLSKSSDRSFDLVITDPPFGDNIFYSDLSNFFHVWLRLPLRTTYPDLFGPEQTPNAQEALAPRAMPKAEANAHYQSLLTACWTEVHRVLKDGGILSFTFHHSEDAQWAIVLESLFDSVFYLEATFPIASDEMKGVGGQFGAKGTEYDIIHVCRKRLEEPEPVSWPKMRQWVKTELRRLRRLLESYKSRKLSAADIRVILRGKALEFYSRHYGKVYTAADAKLSIRDALLGINQLLDEDTDEPGERPPSVLQPICYQFLRLFGEKASLSRDDVGKNLRGTGITHREFVDRGWVEEKSKIIHRVPIKEQFEKTRLRPRREMKTEIDQAHFLIGAALPGSGLNIEHELSKNTWAIRRSVEAVLQWYARIAVEPEVKVAAELAATLLRTSLEQRRSQIVHEQRFLFDDLDDLE